MNKCPVCKSELSLPTPAPDTRTLTLNCPRCGSYLLTFEALAMLHEALSQQPLRWAVTSHAIRRINTPGSAPHKVTQAWLQSVWVNTKLPNPQEQADTFLQYLGTADVASSDWVRCYPQHLSGLLGTADDPTRGETSGFTYVVDHMKDKGLIEQPGPTQLPADDGAMNYRLSFSGWARFDELRRQPGGQFIKEAKSAPEPSAVMSPRVAVVLTAIEAETQAVLRHLADRSRQRVSDTWFHTGRFDGWTIAVAEAGPGNAPAATIATRAFTHFNPDIAAFVGVAGAVKDVGLGDVVVATKVYGYESGKETPEGFLPRADVLRSHHELEQRARVLRSDTMWHRRLDTSLWPDRKPRVYVDPVAAGEAVVAANAGRIATLLRQHYSDALAVEMEGRGFLEAAHIESGCRAVVVRGISDLLKGKARTDKLGWQQRAADAAAAFFFEMLTLESALPCEPAHARNIQQPSIQLDQGASRVATLGRLREFHNERVKHIAGSAPLVPVLDGAILVMHLAPLDTFDAPQPSAFAEICSNPRSFPPIRDTAPRDWKINFQGLFTGSNAEGLEKPQRTYVYIAPSGALEAVVSSIARGRSNKFIPLPEIQSLIIHYPRVYAASLNEFGIHPPLAVVVSLARVKNMRLLQDFIGSAIPEDIPYASLTGDILQFREAVFETVPPTDNSSAKMLHSILVHLANTAGIATPPYFDSDGNYTLKVARPAG